MPDGSNLTGVPRNDKDAEMLSELQARLNTISDRCIWLQIAKQIIFDTLEEMEDRNAPYTRWVERLRFVMNQMGSDLDEVDTLSDRTQPLRADA